MSRDIITEVLNKVQALVEAGIVTYAQVAKDTKISQRTIYNWFGEKRRDRPSGAMAFTLHDWAAQKTLAVAALPNKQQQAYRRAFTSVNQRFPGNGSNERNT